MSKRKEEINNAIKKLEIFKKDSVYRDYQYAIDENIAFLNAIRHIPSYIWWLLNKPKKITPGKLLELTDFPVEDWDVKMHNRLIEIERNKHIGLGKPLVDKILEYIYRENRPLVLVNFGAGGMEVDRQVIVNLIEKKYSHPIIFIGVDKSPTTHEIAKKNIGSVNNLEIVERENLTQEDLNKIKATNKGVVVVLCKNNIFELDNEFSAGSFDLIYHSLFKHHLTIEQQLHLDVLIKKLAKKAYEYDGYKTWRIIVPQTIVAWNYPFFLGATVFSNLRFNTENIMRKLVIDRNRIFFYKNTGHYLLEL